MFAIYRVNPSLCTIFNRLFALKAVYSIFFFLFISIFMPNFLIGFLPAISRHGNVQTSLILFVWLNKIVLILSH